MSQLRSIGKDVYIAVRSDEKAIKSSWKFDSDNLCWLTPKNTYQRFYTEEMVREMFGEVEFIVSDSSMKLFRLK